ncbi:hypothetical protein Csa_012443, partial [Cucumis sativus]
DGATIFRSAAGQCSIFCIHLKPSNVRKSCLCNTLLTDFHICPFSATERGTLLMVTAMYGWRCLDAVTCYVKTT